MLTINAQHACFAPLQAHSVLVGSKTAHYEKPDWTSVDRAMEAGKLTGLPVDAHPHMLRHACGFALGDQGTDTRLIQDYLGHRNIQHTVQYTATNPARFARLWR